MQTRQVIRVAAALALVPFLALAASQEESPSVAAAEALFQKLAELEHAFDPAVAKLDADSAAIKNRRIYPTGQVRELQLPAPQYRALLVAAMPPRGSLRSLTLLGHAAQLRIR